MKNWLSRIRKNRKLFLGSTILLSISFGLSMVTGYLAARFFAGQQTKHPGRLPSIAFNIRKYRIHLHHWLLFLAALIVFIYIDFFLFTPKVFYGFFGGIIYQGIAHYDDWTQVITRQI